MLAICCEGLGRKFLPQIPSVVFYFLKDVFLVGGVLLFGVKPHVKAAVRSLYGRFVPILVLAVTWTAVEMVNPEHQHLGLSLIGFRAYWLWWVAPLVIAGALRDERDRRSVLRALGVISTGIALLAVYQFSQPASSAVNTYALYDGRVMNDVDVVSATGRVRVSSTFSYLSGFVAFTQLVPPILLSLGLAESDRRTRFWCLVGAGLTTAALPMSGSRGPVFIGGAALLAVLHSAGSFRTRAGRRVLMGVAAALVAAFFAFPEATEGVRARFEGRDTLDRINSGLVILPPVAIAITRYPLLGVGTGMKQNAADAFGVRTPWYNEGEPGKLLIELGLPGYVLVWLARFGIAWALLRAARILKQRGQPAMAGAAVAYALLTLTIMLVFDHVAQALFFTGLGMILHAVVNSTPSAAAAPRTFPVGARGPVALSRAR
ncbi:MAG: hypothetical protein AB2A00_00105 [Myxococcota bacterium]